MQLILYENNTITLTETTRYYPPGCLISWGKEIIPVAPQIPYTDSHVGAVESDTREFPLLGVVTESTPPIYKDTVSYATNTQVLTTEISEYGTISVVTDGLVRATIKYTTLATNLLRGASLYAIPAESGGVNPDDSISYLSTAINGDIVYGILMEDILAGTENNPRCLVRLCRRFAS